MISKISILSYDLKSEVNDFVDFLITKKNKTENKRTPKFGCAKGQIIISVDFDEPLEDFKDYV